MRFLPDLSFPARRRARRAFALVCLVLAVLSWSGGRRGSRARQVAVVVAAHPLPPGAVLRTPDVIVVRWPADTAPLTRLAVASAVVGRRLAAPVGVRDPITSTRLVGRDLAAGLPDGQRITAVSVPASASAFVSPGDRVGLMPLEAAPDSTADVFDTGRMAPLGSIVADHLRVLAVLPADDGGASAHLVVACSATQAVRLASRGDRVFAVIGDTS